jgi:hypothetical protein
MVTVQARYQNARIHSAVVTQTEWPHIHHIHYFYLSPTRAELAILLNTDPDLQERTCIRQALSCFCPEVSVSLMHGINPLLRINPRSNPKGGNTPNPGPNRNKKNSSGLDERKNREFPPKKEKRFPYIYGTSVAR